MSAKPLFYERTFRKANANLHEIEVAGGLAVRPQQARAPSLMHELGELGVADLGRLSLEVL